MTEFIPTFDGQKIFDKMNLFNPEELIIKLPENTEIEIRDNVMKKIKLYQDPELDEERRPITKQLTPEEEKLKFKRRSIKNKLHCSLFS